VVAQRCQAARALRESQREMLAGKQPHLYFWAGFQTTAASGILLRG
jgi:CHAT domain-containing protein